MGHFDADEGADLFQAFLLISILLALSTGHFSFFWCILTPFVFLLPLNTVDPSRGQKVYLHRYCVSFGLLTLLLQGGFFISIGLFCLAFNFYKQSKIDELEEYLGSRTTSKIINSPDVWTSL
jgi:hypothetical protein